MTQGIENKVPAFSHSFLSKAWKRKPVLPGVPREASDAATSPGLKDPRGLPLVSPSAGSAPHPGSPAEAGHHSASLPGTYGATARLCLQITGTQWQARVGAGHMFHLGPPASCQVAQPQLGASQVDTIGRTHIRFIREENYSLWTERSGQDIYN